MTRTFQPRELGGEPSRTANTSAGVSCSLPGQNGHALSESGVGALGRCSKSWGRKARRGAKITQSLVVTSKRSTAVLSRSEGRIGGGCARRNEPRRQNPRNRTSRQSQ